MIEALASYRYPLNDFPLCMLGVRLDVIAERFALSLQAWEEDGLGPARGVACRLPSGRVFALRELEHAIQHLGATGPDVFIDVQEVATHGVQPLVAEILGALGLGTEAMTWVQPPDIQDAARAQVESIRRRRAENPRRPYAPSDG